MAQVQAAQLLAQGVQDAWLSGEPQVSFYRSNFKRHVPFASTTERFLVPIDGKIVVNPKSDLLGYIYLTAQDNTTGAFVPNADWSSIISTVELVIGNQSIARHDLTYINTIQKVLEADTYSKRSATSAFQPLGFFFDRQALPLVALKFSDVKINITWISDTVSTQYVYKCWAHCVHLGEDERRFFATKRHQMLIPQIQRIPVSGEPLFRGPLKYIAAPCTNYVGAYSPIPLNITTYSNLIAYWSNESDKSIYSICWSRGNDVYIYNPDGTLFGIVVKTNAFDDTIIIKRDKVTGKVQWVTKIGGAVYDDGYEIETDTAENIYIVGATNSNPMIFYSTDGTSVSLNSPAAFLVKYDTNGIVQWVTRTFGGNLRTLRVEGTNVYIAGYFTSATITAYDAPGTTSSIPSINIVAPAYGANGYIVKYNLTGQAQWMTTISGGSNQGFLFKIISDSTGIYYAGVYTGPTVTIYDAPGTSSSLSPISIPSGKVVCILVKYSFSGQAIWFTKAVGDIINNINARNSLIYYNNSIFLNFGFSPGTVSLYDSQGILQSTLQNSTSLSYQSLIKYDDSGNILWSTKYNGGAGSGFSIYNDTILAYSITTQASFYNIDGSIVYVYRDDISVSNILFAKYSLDGKIISTRKITGNLSVNTVNAKSTLGGIFAVSTNSLYRVYDTGSDSKYQTMPFQNLGSCFIKFMGATI